MDENEVLHLLQHKRHDWMNQIQLVQGYASMGKMERVKEQLRRIIDESEHERRLMNSSAVHFALWLITFNSRHSYYRLAYVINNDVDLSRHDEQLVAYANQTIKAMDEFNVHEELYEGTLQLSDNEENAGITLSWNWTGAFTKEKELIKQLEDIGYRMAYINGSDLYLELTIE
ncbi:Spo0B domain-containing protein [Halobacillus sp. A1]|uniref:Spo0B domain-containing protein n=1 Tax=Halobacillus sp. A1 TaxID=2880262 RepID=UPI0020A67EAB|nr:Spo0B domain-containing protein [Halobacillus sp. A1]MCP3030445.1 Spo0B domain-containing protein [Halobacillus sp. A1]